MESKVILPTSQRMNVRKSIGGHMFRKDSLMTTENLLNYIMKLEKALSTAERELSEHRSHPQRIRTL